MNTYYMGSKAEWRATINGALGANLIQECEGKEPDGYPCIVIHGYAGAGGEEICFIYPHDFPDGRDYEVDDSAGCKHEYAPRYETDFAIKRIHTSRPAGCFSVASQVNDNNELPPLYREEITEKQVTNRTGYLFDMCLLCGHKVMR